MSVSGCGTYAGVQAHIRRREPLCEPCREARNQYRRDHYRRTGSDRRQAAAYLTAERWLREAHREEFDRLYDKAREEAGLPRRWASTPRDGDKKQARGRVTYLITSGRLPPAKEVPCTDCGHLGPDSRHSYDHYLGYGADHHEDVQAVCYQCHHERERRRGTRY